MIQSGGFLVGLLTAIPQAMFLARKEALKRGLKKGVILTKNAATELAEKATEHYVNKGINELYIKFTLNKTSNEIKDIIKVIR